MILSPLLVSWFPFPIIHWWVVSLFTILFPRVAVIYARFVTELATLPPPKAKEFDYKVTTWSSFIPGVSSTSQTCTLKAPQQSLLIYNLGISTFN